MMDSKIIYSIMALAIVAFGLAAATIFASPDDASAKQSCESKKWSNCKGDKGYYTEKGHHHCYKDLDKQCKKYN
jgi:hypothetical protein